MNNREGASPPPQQEPEPRRLKQLHIPWYRRRKRIILSCIICLLIISTLLIAFFVSRGPSLPKNIKSQVKFTTFLPTNLPEGYAIDVSSYKYKENVLSFQIKLPSSTLLVSEQPQPTSFDLSNFYKGLKNTQSTNTPYGTAQVGRFLKSEAGSIVALGTWVFISGSPDTDPGQILTIFSSLQKTN